MDLLHHPLLHPPVPRHIKLSRPQPDASLPRLFFMHGLKQGTRRGDHAHRAQHQFLIAMHGRFDITWIHAQGGGKITLSDPRQGLHVAPLTWITLEARTDDAVCLVLASDVYDEADYIRNRAEFDRLIAC